MAENKTVKQVDRSKGEVKSMAGDIDKAVRQFLRKQPVTAVVGAMVLGFIYATIRRF